jgi:hypothetical protein
MSNMVVVRNQTACKHARRHNTHSHRSHFSPGVGKVLATLRPVVAEVVRDRLVERGSERDTAQHCQRLVPPNHVGVGERLFPGSLDRAIPACTVGRCQLEGMRLLGRERAAAEDQRCESRRETEPHRRPGSVRQRLSQRREVRLH